MEGGSVSNTFDSGQSDGLSDSAHRVLLLVRQYDAPVGIEELARRLGKHTNTVREHINVLVRTGAVTRFQKAPDGRGRPAWFYQAAAVAPTVRPGFTREADTPRYSHPPRGEGQGAQALFRMLEELGFEPEHDGAPGRIRVRACPLKHDAFRNGVYDCATRRRAISAVIQMIGDDLDAYDFAEAHDLVVRTG